MSLAQVELIIAKKVADACKKDLYGLHGKDEINWNLIMVKTLGLQAIGINALTSYLTADQEAQILAKISNPNINL